MFGKPPFVIPDNYGVGVRNLAAASAWYKDKLGLSEIETDREEDSGRPFMDLAVSKNDAFLSLVELAQGASPERQHVIFYARASLEKAHKWFEDRGVTVEPITQDSGGNHLFRFRDLDGNAIEVCVEP
jgi:catechol 2,3-dioxygenase-like lactoylglutathione lyase family enzyme